MPSLAKRRRRLRNQSRHKRSSSPRFDKDISGDDVKTYAAVVKLDITKSFYLFIPDSNSGSRTIHKHPSLNRASIKRTKNCYSRVAAETQNLPQ